MYKILAACLFLWVSCTTMQPRNTESGDDSNTNQTSDNSSIIPAAPGSRNTVGTLVNIPMSVPESNMKRMQVYKMLGAPYVRHTLTMQSWNGSNDFYEKLNNAGYKIILNVVATPQGGGPRPFTHDMATYKKKLEEILSVYKPELLVVENEEYNQTYYNGYMSEYLTILKTAIEVAHSKGVKVCNGGLTGRLLSLLTYFDYRDRGLMSEADDFAKRTQLASINQVLPNISKIPYLEKGMIGMDTLIKAYKNLNLDYVNFHWYEPMKLRSPKAPSAANVDQVDTKSIGEVVDFLKRSTGKKIITNEIGQINSSPNIVKSVIDKCVSLNMDYIVWYSGDGDDVNDAIGLHNYDGTLRPNGKAFAEYIKQKFPN